MLKVAYLIPVLTDCGLTRIPFWLSKNLSDKVDIEFFYFRQKSFSQRGEELIPIDELPVQKIDFYKVLPDLNKFDIIHSHGFIPDIYLLFHSSKITAKTVTTIHGYHLTDLKYEKGLFLSFLMGNIWDIACKKFDMAVCLTHSMECFYKSKGINRITTIYNGVEKPIIDTNNSFLINSSKNSDCIYLSTVSSLNPRKGVEQILKLLQRDERYVFTGVGGSTLDIERLKNIALQLNVKNRCTFIGHCNNPWEYVINSDVFIFPSRSEGFGLVLAEAALLEIPILCTDIPTFREMFTDDEASFFQMDNIDDLHNKVLQLELLKQKKAKAMIKAKDMFDVLKMCEEYERIYRSL